jgi:hypothetical protein
MNHQFNKRKQRIFYGICIILGFVLGSHFGCGNTKCPEVKVEPTIIKVKDSGNTKPSPVKIEVIEPGRIPEMAASKPIVIYKNTHSWDTLWMETLVDTTAILQDYFAKYMYADTFRTKYGNVVVLDTVTRNKIEGRKYLVDFTIPSEIKYVTQEAKQKNQIYFSMGGLYNMNALSVGGGLLLKTKRDRMFGVNAYLGTDGMLTYNFQTMLKISLKK